MTHHRGPHPVPWQERLWDKVGAKDANGCMPWLASLNASGYGQFSKDRVPVRAHRLVYELLVGPVPEGLHLGHLCRNRKCVNPEHLEPVTQRVNNERAVRETCRSGKHRWDAQEPINKPSGRQCRLCNNERRRARYADVITS